MTDDNVLYKKKNRLATEARILDAFRSLIQERGFAETGINLIAERAAVNKVLIYRYFGGMQGLCDALAEELDLAALGYAEELVGLIELGSELKPQLVTALCKLHDRLSGDKLSLALMAEELHGDNELTRALAAARESRGSGVGISIEQRLAAVSGSAKAVDMQARLALVSASLFYLTLRARTVKLFNGIELQSSEGRERLYAAMADCILA
ncbi:MAG: TetR/AcrR family transcriptional regulator [Spirochaetes bacterium]|nr:TetR/AcrR family transcriptional regulator [Spirochaetota bacterium]